MATIDSTDLVARMASAARAVHRFSRWGSACGLAVGVVLFLSLAPWLPQLGSGAWPAGVVVAAVLVGAPLRVMWHGSRINAAYGDRAHVDRLVAEIPDATDELARHLDAAVAPEGRGLRRLVSSWRSLLAVRRLVQDSPARERADALIDPLRPEALGLTTTAVWVTLVVLVSGLPIALISLGVLALT